MSDFLTPLFSATMSKKSQEDAFEVLKKKVVDGEVSPIEAFANVKCLAEVLAKFLKDGEVNDIVVDALQRDKDVTTFRGVKFSVAETGVKYFYEDCGDPVWEDLNMQKKEVAEKMKEREAFLKHISDEGVTIVDEESGEVKQVHRPGRQSTTSVKLTFPK